MFRPIGSRFSGTAVSPHKNIQEAHSGLDGFSTVIILLAGSLVAFINGYVNLRNAHYGFISLFYMAAVLVCPGIWNLSKIINKSEKLRLVDIILQRIGRDSIVYLCTNQMVIMLVSAVLEGLHIDMKWSLLCNGVLTFALVLLVEEVLRLLFTRTSLKFCIGK